MKKKQEASPAEESLSLTEEEFQGFMSLHSAREKLDLMQENMFLKASVRLKTDLTKYGVDLNRKVFVKNPQAQETPPPAPTAAS